jgi:hypothetical protein
VVLDDQELAQIQRAARRSRMTTAEWVRQALRSARRAEPGGNARKKIAAVRAATAHDFPTADLDQMLREIERGYVADGAP